MVIMPPLQLTLSDWTVKLSLTLPNLLEQASMVFTGILKGHSQNIPQRQKSVGG